MHLIHDGNADNKLAWKLLLGAGRYQFEADGFIGHTLRNLFHFALEQVALQEGFGRRDAQRIVLNALNLAYRVPPQHRVITATWASAVVQAETKEGEVITGQAKINLRGLKEPYPDEIRELYLVPPVKASPEAKEAIRALQPGDKLFISCGDTLSDPDTGAVGWWYQGSHHGVVRRDHLRSASDHKAGGNAFLLRQCGLYGRKLINWIEKAIGKGILIGSSMI